MNFTFDVRGCLLFDGFRRGHGVEHTRASTKHRLCNVFIWCHKEAVPRLVFDHCASHPKAFCIRASPRLADLGVLRSD